MHLKTTQEEAAVYLPFQLAGRDISAYLVDGAFSWSFMGPGLADLLSRGGVVGSAHFTLAASVAIAAPGPPASWDRRH